MGGPLRMGCDQGKAGAASEKPQPWFQPAMSPASVWLRWPAQHPSAHLLLHRGQIFWCRSAGLGKLDLPVLARGDAPSITQQWKWKWVFNPTNPNRPYPTTCDACSRGRSFGNRKGELTMPRYFPFCAE